MKDCNGVSLTIGDIVWYRRNAKATNFDGVGIAKKSDDSRYLIILSTTHMFLEKLPANVRKMPDEEAMIWKLENA